ncbi:MAG: 2TM domain-containing protein [Chitinophagaceae bacterium]|nr:MAG: 2TM domain-containing protein [Chitinophagaceae bacterium]
MSNYSQSTPEGKDPQIWEIAQRRASFRYHLASYVVVIGAMWVFWAISSGENGHNRYPWPVWPTLGWGIGLTFHFLGAFVFPKQDSVEREYEKMMRNRK